MFKINSILYLLLISSFGIGSIFSTNDDSENAVNNANLNIDEIPSSQVKVEIIDGLTSNKMFFIEDHTIFIDRWDELPQVKFWKKVMLMPNDTGLFNVAETRQILKPVSMKWWNKLNDTAKENFKDSLRTAYGLEKSTRVYLTEGKNHFYNFSAVMPGIDKAIKIFEDEQTDPFYAQAILLIESPTHDLKSPVGAYGSFQLMAGVARNMGLKVNSTIDERKDFDKSAWAAAKLIRTVCVPYTNEILLKNKIQPEPNALWYKLLVLHVYHAGAYNVGKAVAAMNPEKGGQEFIAQLWQTKAGAFGNASQNYSQVALASLLLLDEAIYNRCESANYCPYPNIMLVKE